MLYSGKVVSFSWVFLTIKNRYSCLRGEDEQYRLDVANGVRKNQRNILGRNCVYLPVVPSVS